MTDFSDDEAFAAEYVLGTLDGVERATAEARRRDDPSFEALAAAWEARLAPLAAAAPELAPPPALFGAIVSRLPIPQADYPTDNILILRHRMRVWRGIAVATSGLAAVLALWIVGREVIPSTPAAQTYVAVLQHGADTPSFVVSLDLSHRRMTVLPLAMNAPPDKSYELWMIGPDAAAPRSLGVLNAQAAMRPQLPNLDSGKISNATYAVTLEPHGGSPTGQPTSTPLYVGKLLHMSL